MEKHSVGRQIGWEIICLNISKVLPIRKLTGLIIDESGLVKQGDKSVVVESGQTH